MCHSGRSTCFLVTARCTGGSSREHDQSLPLSKLPRIICEWLTFNLIQASGKLLTAAVYAARTRPAPDLPSDVSPDAVRGYISFLTKARLVLSNVAALPGLRTSLPVYLDDMMMVRRASDNLSAAWADFNDAMCKLYAHFQEDPEAPIEHDFYELCNLSPSEADEFSATRQ